MQFDLHRDFGANSSDHCLVYASRSKSGIQKWHWRRSAANGKRLSRSSEGYREKAYAVEVCLRCNSDLPKITLQPNGQIRLTAS